MILESIVHSLEQIDYDGDPLQFLIELTTSWLCCPSLILPIIFAAVNSSPVAVAVITPSSMLLFGLISMVCPHFSLIPDRDVQE